MWPRSVRASHLERTCVLPGDELIPEPIGTLTHAITIRRPAREVWPWLAQMGAGSRAGWYSYDVIDNGRRRSAARIVEELQHIGVGTLFPAVPGRNRWFPRPQIRSWAEPRARVATCSERVANHDVAFVLDAVNDGTTRLVVRARAARGYPFYGLPPSIGMPFIRFGHFIMQRRQLLGIAHHAESRQTRGTNTTRSEAA